MIGSTKLFINSDSQKEILLNWDQLRWFNQLKRGRIVLTRLAGKNQEILEPTDLDSHYHYWLLSPQKSAMLLNIAWLKNKFDRQCTILFSAISEMKGAKKSELDSEHVLDISKIFWQIICSAASLLRDSRKVNNPLIIFLWEQHTLYAGHIVYWESCGTTRPVVLWANLQTRANLSGKLKHKFVLFFSYSRHYRAFLRLQLTLFLRAVSMN